MSVPVPAFPDRSTRIEVVNASTLDVARNLANQGHRVAALNFASAKNPGGGFLSGAQAQEESLARDSGLYAMLLGDPMYDYHRSRPDPLYTTWVIYSPDVPVEFRAGSSNDLPGELGRFRLVVIGRAFHWMDRAETLRRLDAMVEPAGAVVLFGDRHLPLPENQWTTRFKELTERYAAADAARTVRHSPDWLNHEAVLLDSPFCRLERHSVVERRSTPVARLVDRALSYSSVSYGLTDEQIEELARSVREAMTAFVDGDAVSQVIESEALVCRRADDAS